MNYWLGTTKDGQKVSEKIENWVNIKENLSSLSMFIQNKNITIKLPDNMEYIHAKSCEGSIGADNCEIKSRYIGFKLGNNVVKIRVHDSTSEISVEVTRKI